MARRRRRKKNPAVSSLEWIALFAIPIAGFAWLIYKTSTTPAEAPRLPSSGG